MTAETRFERELPAILEDLYLGPSPDYRDEVMAAAVRSRQRPSWTFAGRWFPMADIATRPVPAPRVPWRAAALALMVIALIVAAAALIAGSRQTRLPSPFGLAVNGLITYDLKGDIYTVDPATGVTTAIVTGPEQDAGPVFSPDGTRVAFHRSHPIDGTPADDLVVVATDGSKPVVITTDPIRGGVGRYEWAPDSKTLLVNAAGDSAIWSFDTTTTSSPRTVTTGAIFYTRPYQPPMGTSILIYRKTDQGAHIGLFDLATSHEIALDKGRGQRLRCRAVVSRWIAGRVQRRAGERSVVAAPVHRERRRYQHASDHQRSGHLVRHRCDLVAGWQVNRFHSL